MRQRSRLLVPVLAALVLAAAPACRSANPWSTDEQQSDAVRLVVRNNNFADMDIWAVGDGLPTRIGTVTGNSSGSFALNSSLYSATDFRVVATPIGGNGRAGSGPLVVRNGQTIEFTINPQLRLSTAMIR